MASDAPARFEARGVGERGVLLLSVFVVGLCTLVYELLIGTVSSYLQGDSVRQFSITIGLSMSAMGVGTWLSRLVRARLLPWFLAVEVSLGVLGGLSVPVLLAVYAFDALYYVAMIGMILALGILIGMEIPLLTRILAERDSLRANISNVLSLDYFGALAGTLLFPFVLLPFLGTFKSSMVAGLLNLGVAALTLWWLGPRIAAGSRRFFRRAIAAAALLLTACFAFADPLIHGWESSLYEDRIVLSQESRYQRIVLTRGRGDLRLFLNGHLQFSSQDEHRYHEALVHVAGSFAPRRARVLLLGGGDGLAVRELLRYPDVREIVVVDLDPAVTRLAATHPLLVAQNEGSLGAAEVHVVNEDGFEYVENGADRFDLVIADLPDPNSAALARLYSREFYRLVRRRLAADGVFVTQATSPYFSREAFWCINRTLAEAGFERVHPFHAVVPSMGDWGFALATDLPGDPGAGRLAVSTRFLDADLLPTLFTFARDVAAPPVEASSLGRPSVLAYYLEGWKQWN